MCVRVCLCLCVFTICLFSLRVMLRDPERHILVWGTLLMCLEAFHYMFRGVLLILRISLFSTGVSFDIETFSESEARYFL